MVFLLHMTNYRRYVLLLSFYNTLLLNLIHSTVKLLVLFEFIVPFQIILAVIVKKKRHIMYVSDLIIFSYISTSYFDRWVSRLWGSPYMPWTGGRTTSYTNSRPPSPPWSGRWCTTTTRWIPTRWVLMP